MERFVFLCTIACLLQITLGQAIGCNGNPLAPGLPGPLAGVPLTPPGYGDVSIIGELPVGGSTAVVGNVPIVGFVTFEGIVPANGMVSLANGECKSPY